MATIVEGEGAPQEVEARRSVRMRERFGSGGEHPFSPKTRVWRVDFSAHPELGSRVGTLLEMLSDEISRCGGVLRTVCVQDYSAISIDDCISFIHPCPIANCPCP